MLKAISWESNSILNSIRPTDHTVREALDAHVINMQLSSCEGSFFKLIILLHCYPARQMVSGIVCIPDYSSNCFEGGPICTPLQIPNLCKERNPACVCVAGVSVCFLARRSLVQ